MVVTPNPPQHTPEDELTDTEKTIVSYTDPDRFIDLLNWDSFVRGQQDGKIPVERHRIMFEKWLQSYLDTKVIEARIDELNRTSQFDLEDLGNYIPNRIIVLERSKIQATKPEKGTEE
jgi:hypothetical protein